MLGLVLSSDVDEPDSLCVGDFLHWKNSQREFSESLRHGRFESICVDDYVPFFAEALAEFAASCGRFIPQ